DYSYSLKDHLGNTRVVFKEDGVGGTEIVTTAAYYPFGSEIEDFQKQSNPLYSYLYNGKELDSDFGLNYYHYGARIYDPIKGRFISIDPISDQFAFVSPYNYAENKPINSIDLHGLQAWEINFDRRRLDQKPPKRSEKDWMGPAIGGALTGMTFFIPGPEDFVLAGIATKSLQVAKSFNVSAKALKGLGITKDAIKVTEGVSDQITVIGEGMKRVLGFADELGEAGAKNINTFKPSEGALKEWDELTEGGKYLSDDLVKETKIFKENKQWINEAKESGSTIVDIGDDGRKKASSFYEMEKQTVYE
ncbi:MAG: RHS repeat-associated core domain-containing protein, partial [Bacteroidota bacterium]